MLKKYFKGSCNVKKKSYQEWHFIINNGSLFIIILHIDIKIWIIENWNQKYTSNDWIVDWVFFEKNRDISRRIKYFRILEQSFSQMCSDKIMEMGLGWDQVLLSC